MLAQRTLRKVVVNSRLCLEQLKEIYGFDESRVRLIRNGVDSSYFSREALASSPAHRDMESLREFTRNRTTLLFISNNYARKGLFELMDFMASGKGGGCQLIVAGRGDAEQVSGYSREKGLGARVLCAGFCRDVRWLFYFADIFVLPTYYDPFANACMEAASFGLPVVTTRMNGFSELIRSGENGWVMESPSDHGSLAKALDAFSGSRGRQDLSGRCRSAVMEFTPERNARETLALFGEMA
jgi:UDP-glucose:(heptosyl)LPS alpha-1,3-glucosyltransferase